MDFTSIYELRDCLRVSMIAGTAAVEEDFRLKRAVEKVKPLSAAAPVFAKITELCEKLLAPDETEKAFLLMDAVSMTDAVISTLQSVSVKDEAQDIEADSINGIITDIPYTDLRNLTKALTERSGSGYYDIVENFRTERPEVFRDFRVQPVFVKGLGSLYYGIPVLVSNIMIEDKENNIVPLLKKDFNPKGGKEMERRLNVIMEKEGAAANDFYLEILPEAKKNIRCEVIDALGFSEDNKELLVQLVKSEKGIAKEAAEESLYRLDSKLYKKIDEEVYENLDVDKAFEKVVERLKKKLSKANLE